MIAVAASLTPDTSTSSCSLNNRFHPCFNVVHLVLHVAPGDGHQHEIADDPAFADIANNEIDNHGTDDDDADDDVIAADVSTP